MGGFSDQEQRPVPSPKHQRGLGEPHWRSGSDITIREFAYIDWLRRRTPGPAPRVLSVPATTPLCFAVRAIATAGDHRHAAGGQPFPPGRGRAAPRGRKAMAVNLSDIAAMAGTDRRGRQRRPAAAGRPGWPRNCTRPARDGDAFDTAIVGGDTNTWTAAWSSRDAAGRSRPPGARSAGRRQARRLAARHRPAWRQHPGQASRLHAARSRSPGTARASPTCTP